LVLQRSKADDWVTAMRLEYECSHCEGVVGNVIRDEYGFIKKMSKGLWKAEPGAHYLRTCGNGMFKKIMIDVVCAGCGHSVDGREIN
jgi:hypothetical protein